MADSLPGLQGDDDEDGSPIHAPDAAAVTHEVVQDGGEFCSHLSSGEAGKGLSICMQGLPSTERLVAAASGPDSG